MNGRTIAMVAITARMSSPASAARCLRKRRRARRPALSPTRAETRRAGTATSAVMRSVGSIQADPRIGDAVRKVRCKVAEQHDRRDKDGEGLDDGVIAAVDGAERERAHPGPCEDR